VRRAPRTVVCKTVRGFFDAAGPESTERVKKLALHDLDSPRAPS
jgi:hypothetical protein